ncbi:MAG: hypothetical protein NTX50_09815 [Candidatus Sumerlaeota bacterium]|nr:hypothetical protein [Candidatus Sumerlaeota bacterium]
MNFMRFGNSCIWPCAALVFILYGRALQSAEPMMLEKLEGPPTAKEVQAFKGFMQEAQPPANNIRNAMVYGSGGVGVEALGRMFELCGDVELLDRMIAFTDRMLSGRNDPTTGVIVWTGGRELVWPNAAPVNGKPVYSGTENGDVAGHIAYTAKLILQNRKLWEAKIPGGDLFGFGATYLERAKTYVREMDRTTDEFILKWIVKPDTLRYYFPDSPLYDAVTKPGAANSPVPWNQQMMLNNGFQRLAECHEILDDDAARVKRYDAIVKASVDWFFSSVKRLEVKGRPCYQWTYVAENPMRHYEDTGHGSYDVMGLVRAYASGRYGITAEMMAPLANTVTCILAQPGGKFATRVDGTVGARGAGGLGGNWIDLCEFEPGLFPIFVEMNRGRLKSSPGLVANLLWQRRQISAKSKKDSK